MFSGAGFCEFAFCEHSYTPLDTSAFEAFLAEEPSPRCWILELDAFSLATTGGVSAAFADHGFANVGFGEAADQVVGGESTLRYATHGYTSHAADSPANTYHDARIGRPPVVDRQIAGRGGVGGLTTVFAEIALVNRDGALDMVKRQFSIEGRRARILIGRETDALSSFGVLFTGVVQSATVSEDAMQLRLSDGSARLRRRLANEAVFAGSGGLEGGDDLKGKTKPVAFGYCANVAPPLVDSARLIYQVNDGEIQDVPEAFDRGVALTKGADYSSAADMNATAPSAGYYRVYKAGGYIRLGATPDGTVTCNVEGDADPSYLDTAAEIVQRMLTQRAELNSSEIDPTAFNALALAAPASVGFWAGTAPVTCEQVADELLWSVGAFGGFSRHGAFTVGLVADPTGVTEEATYTRAEVLKPGVVLEPLPGDLDPIVWRVRVGWGRNHTVQNDLAAAVTAAQRTFAAEPIRYSTVEDAAVQSRHRLARELQVDAYYELEADAQTERDRLAALWGAPRNVFRVPLKLPALVHDLGSVIRLEDYPRFGLQDGAAARVIGHRVDGSRVELRVLV